MARLIDADSMIQSIENNEYYTDKLKRVMNSIVDSRPTVDAVPVVHGEWRRIKETGFFKAECSACGKTEYCTSKYCPNCGAKMSNGERKGGDE